MIDKTIWLTWEDHRRSRELSEAFGAEYVLITLDWSRYIRYPVLTLLTLWKVLVKRPKLVFCQNPSIVLNIILVIFKPLFQYKLVVDRHSNFKFEHQFSPILKWRIFWCLSKVTVKCADLMIVTNEPLRKICNSWGGRAVVLPDKLPDMTSNGNSASPVIEDQAKINVMAVTTFDSDEPVDEIIEAASLLGDDFKVYLTGNYHKYLGGKSGDHLFPGNVKFTGYISEADYRGLMNSADIVLVLTTKNLILNCGAYEAVSANKPLVLSNTEILRNYFYCGVIFVDINPQSIAAGICDAWENRGYLTTSSRKLAVNLKRSWLEQFQLVENYIASSVHK